VGNHIVCAFWQPIKKNQMKKKLSVNLIILFIAIIFTSCSQNTFQARKNYQPRIKIEANKNVPVLEEEGIVTNNLTTQTIAVKTTPIVHGINIPKKQHNIKVKKENQPLVEKLVKAFFPKQKKMLDQLKDQNGNKLNKVKGNKMDDTQITGLVISLLALALAIASLFMIIGMAHVSLWSYFAVGMILAAVACGMAFIAKHLLPFKGISLAAGALAILAMVLLIIFMVLIVAGVVF